MKCECCGKETEILIEIGAISPKVSVTGKCCTECCTFILSSLEDADDDRSRKAELIPVSEKDAFVDESGRLVDPGEIRFGMKDAAGQPHYFCIRPVAPIP